MASRARSKKAQTVPVVEPASATTPTSSSISPSVVVAASSSSASSPGTEKGKQLLVSIRNRLAQMGNAGRAKTMQAYMKSAIPCHGVPVPTVRKEMLSLLEESPIDITSAQEFRDMIDAMYAGITFREEFYATASFLRRNEFRKFRVPSHASGSASSTKGAMDEANRIVTETNTYLDLLKRIIVIGGWWDVVDELAPHVVGELMRPSTKNTNKELEALVRATTIARLDEWSKSDQLWLRRSSILAQLNYSTAELDFSLLQRWIEPAIVDSQKEFFLRKAIGWSLRQIAKDKAALPVVINYVNTNAVRLHPLSITEALKHFAQPRAAALAIKAKGGAAAASQPRAAAASPSSAAAAAAGTAAKRGRKRKTENRVNENAEIEDEKQDASATVKMEVDEIDAEEEAAAAQSRKRGKKSTTSASTSKQSTSRSTRSNKKK